MHWQSLGEESLVQKRQQPTSACTSRHIEAAILPHAFVFREPPVVNVRGGGGGGAVWR